MEMTQKRAFEILDHCYLYLYTQHVDFTPETLNAYAEAVAIIAGAMDACGIL